MAAASATVGVALEARAMGCWVVRFPAASAKASCSWRFRTCTIQLDTDACAQGCSLSDSRCLESAGRASFAGGSVNLSA